MKAGMIELAGGMLRVVLRMRRRGVGGGSEVDGDVKEKTTRCVERYI